MPETPVNDELSAMRIIVRALEKLDLQAQRRVVRYFVDRYRSWDDTDWSKQQPDAAS